MPSDRRQRFIPAGAGNAASTSPLHSRRAVHPRGCGERRWLSRQARNRDGSSPRVRGTRGTYEITQETPRFIPAGAGNAPALATARTAVPVHPRGCGERPVSSPHVRQPLGSSPRVRGTRGRLRPQGADVRFIPAGAGNAAEIRPAVHHRAVHPRGCGERKQYLAWTARFSGSSPRVRGTLNRADHPLHERRFIPAGAGNAGTSAIPRRAAAVHPRGCGERGRR